MADLYAMNEAEDQIRNGVLLAYEAGMMYVDLLEVIRKASNDYAEGNLVSTE